MKEPSKRLHFLLTKCNNQAYKVYNVKFILHNWNYAKAFNNINNITNIKNISKQNISIKQISPNESRIQRNNILSQCGKRSSNNSNTNEMQNPKSLEITKKIGTEQENFLNNSSKVGNTSFSKFLSNSRSYSTVFKQKCLITIYNNNYNNNNKNNNNHYSQNENIENFKQVQNFHKKSRQILNNESKMKSSLYISKSKGNSINFNISSKNKYEVFFLVGIENNGIDK